MDEKDLPEKTLEQRKAEIEYYKDQEEEYLKNISEEEMTNYLMGVFEDNEKIIEKYGFNTISEEDIHG